jgi:hypothetical protein
MMYVLLLAHFLLFFVCVTFILMYFPRQNLVRKFVALGNECVEYLNATRASEGNFLSYALLVLNALLCFFT